MMGNLFVKYKGLELFGTLESAKGRGLNEQDERKTSQLAGDLIYRFGSSENFYIGGRYNTVTSRPAGAAFTDDVTINRIAVAAGWFPTKNLLTKIEYVNQEYKDYPSTNIMSNGKFNGIVIEAVIGF
jgi:hypothetical protein